MNESRRDRFERLAPGLIEPVRRYLARRTDPATADDVLAETLLVCWRRAEELPEEPLPWVYGVARNCLRNAERAARRQERVAARIVALDPPAESLPGRRTATRSSPMPWPRCAPTTPSCCACGRGSSWTPAEIAVVLGVTANAVAIRLHRAKRKLASGLRKTGAVAGHEESREGRRP